MRLKPERIKELTLLLLIIAALVVFSLVVDNYMSGRFFSRVTQGVAVTAVLAAGQSLVIITRNIDLSVGSIAGVSGYLTGEVLGNHLGTPTVVAVLLAVAIGTLLGFVNGALVAYGRIPSIIVTLGTLAIYRTWLISYAEARTITASSLPQWLVDLPRSTVFSIGEYDFRTMFVLAIVVILVLQVLLSRVRAGRILYAIGSNPEAALQIGSTCTTHDDRRLHGVRSARRPRRVPRARPLRDAHRIGRPRARARVDRRFRRRRGQHPGRLGDDRRQLLRRGTDRPARPEPRAGAPDQRVRARCRARAAHPARRRARWVAGTAVRAPAHDHAHRRHWRRTDDCSGHHWRCGVSEHQHNGRLDVADVVRRNPWESLLLVIFVGTVIFNVTQSTNYLDIDNFVNLFELSIEKVIIVVMMTFVIIAGEIDLSVASVMGLSAAVLAVLNDGDSVPFWLAVVIAVAAGSAAGLVQGWCISRLGLPSLVVTLAGLIGLRGLARVFVEDRSFGGFPSWFEELGQESLIGPLPFSVVLFLVGIVVGGIVLARTALGRRVYVIGDNADVARYSALNVGRFKIGLFVASGTVAAVAGVLYAARLGSVRGDMASGFELDIITMVLLGGVSIFGGAGTMTGVALAVLIVLNLRNGLGLANVEANVQTGVVGVILITSVLARNAIDSLRRRWDRSAPPARDLDVPTPTVGSAW